jgi:hypothetical protein
VKFTRIARDAEGFDRALRDGSADGAYASELSLTAALAAVEVHPGAQFTADLRGSLLQAARDGALVAGPPIHTSRRSKRRWTIAAPAAAVALATGGVAFAVTGLQTSAHPTSVAAPSSTTSALSTAHTQLADVSQLIRAGHPSADSLSALRTQALRLQDTLIGAYRSGSDPQAVRELHDFAVSAISQLAGLHAEIPASLTSLYMSTLQTLVDIATNAQSACPTCGLSAVQLPSSVAPWLHVSTTAPVTSPSGAPSSPPRSSTAPAVRPPSVTPTTQPGLPTIVPLPTLGLPTGLPTLG